MLTLLAPAATILVGLIGLAGVLATIRQRSSAEAAERYWKRLSWALEAALSDDPRTRETAIAALHALLYDEHCDATDARLIAAVLAAHE